MSDSRTVDVEKLAKLAGFRSMNEMTDPVTIQRQELRSLLAAYRELDSLLADSRELQEVQALLVEPCGCFVNETVADGEVTGVFIDRCDRCKNLLAAARRAAQGESRE